MRKRPKYKEGDILEFWYKNDPFDIELFIITKVVLTKGTRLGHYRMVSLRNGRNPSHFVANVDMIRWSLQTRNCLWGWRKIG